jgi:phospholipid/cholesterol/gamma-HCH transport system substrate-binding protein
MMTAIRKRAGDFAAILGLVIIAAIVGGYILKNQRLRFPLIEEKPMRINASFSTAQAVTPGQGQTVRVAGVKIGDIGTVELKDGRAIIGMDIDPEYSKGGFIRKDASALLRTKTGLKDMFIELNPGTNQAEPVKQGWTLPINNTLPDVNPDEILTALDADTRDYLKLLVNGAGKGLDGRGGQLQEVFARFEPTNRDIARLTTALAGRRHNLRRLINRLQVLNTELASASTDVTQLIESSSVVFRAFAAEQVGLKRTLREFPSSLRQTSTTLAKVERFAHVLRPTADRLRPAVRAIAPANRAVQGLAVEATPIVRDQIRPFLQDARPLVNELVKPVNRLADATPDLQESFVQLNNLFDLLGYNDNGREGPGAGRNRDEGFLFQVAWVLHGAKNLFSLQDANATYRPVFIGGTCQIYRGLLENTAVIPGATDLILFAFNFVQIVNNPVLCPPAGPASADDAKERRAEKQERRQRRADKADEAAEEQPGGVVKDATEAASDAAVEQQATTPTDPGVSKLQTSPPRR